MAGTVCGRRCLLKDHERISASVMARVAAWVALVLGAGALALLVAWHGLAEIAALMAAAGWPLLTLAFFAVPELGLSAASWRLLFLPGRRPPFLRALQAMWIGFSINMLLPVAMMGGEVVKARLLILWSQAAPDAVVSIVVDKTVQAIAVLLSALLGIGLLAVLAPDPEVITAAAIGTGLLGAGILGFVLVQHAHPFRALTRLARRIGGSDRRLTAFASARQADATLRALYRRPHTLLAACTLRFLARITLLGEIWLAAYLMGYPIGLLEALVLKSLTVALRGAAFVVPAGLGVQEGAFVILGQLLGLPPEVALAIGLATRIREVVPSIPGLIAWQAIESRHAWRDALQADVPGRSSNQPSH